MCSRVTQFQVYLKATLYHLLVTSCIKLITNSRCCLDVLSTCYCAKKEEAMESFQQKHDGNIAWNEGQSLCQLDGEAR